MRFTKTSWAGVAVATAATVTLTIGGCSATGNGSAASRPTPVPSWSPIDWGKHPSTASPSPSPTATVPDYTITCTVHDDSTRLFYSLDDAWAYSRANPANPIASCHADISPSHKPLPGETEAIEIAHQLDNHASGLQNMGIMLAVCAEVPPPGEDMPVATAFMSGALKLCPSAPHAAALRAGHTNDRTFPDGQYEVVPVGQEGGIKPGTYHGKAGAQNCYWERTTSSGETIDNNLITYSPSGPVVTVRSSDGGFVSRNCGPWTRTS